MSFEVESVFSEAFFTLLIPGLVFTTWITDLSSTATSLFILGCVFFGVPVVWKYSYYLQEAIVYSQYFANPFLNVKQPDKVGLYATRNFYIKHQIENTSIRLGVWHILPNNIVKRYSKIFNVEITSEKCEKSKNVEKLLMGNFDIENEKCRKDFFEETLRSSASNGIVLYLHGNAGNRAGSSRPLLCKVLRKLNYHVVTFDYRGFGDSSNITPTEKGVVDDSFAVYKYITDITDAPIYIWGHSLGAAIAIRLASRVTEENSSNGFPLPKAVTLDCPFTNVREETFAHPLAWYFRNIPWYNYFIVRPMYTHHFRFESDIHIKEFRQPVLILHAEDDLVVPFYLGRKLYRIAVETRDKTCGPVLFRKFDRCHQYGHLGIPRAPELPEIVQAFFNKYKDN